MHTYDFKAIERKWRDYWIKNKTFRAPNPGDPGFDPGRPKFYVLDMFPYPSGAGLHVGHPVGYIASDIVARYKRMTGYNVLHPMGFDAFGLPAEQYAVETGTHPEVTTNANIETFRRQLRALALSIDWDREVATTDPAYYRWTQWIFLQLFESWYDAGADRARPIAELREALEADAMRVADGALLRRGEDGFDDAPPWDGLDERGRRRVVDGQRLAYVDEVPVNWCPELGTVLANEEVTADGRSERGNFPVFRRPLEQWMLRITAYAERLLADLDGLDWPEALKLMQRNWIGRSEGARVRFAVAGGPGIEVFTTRPDTLFGATYMVLAPEHPLVGAVTTAERREAVAAYRNQAAAKTELDRQVDARTKDGVFTGGFARNPVNGKEIPIWIADYVLMGYGTGAIMAVPGHDQRDFEFARTFDLPIVPVVGPPDAWLEEQRAAGNAPDAGDLRAAYLENPGSFADAFTGEGEGIHSENESVSLNGRETPEAKRVITEWLADRGLGSAEVQYKLRDWLFSRQRYWGEPFPILHGPDGEVAAVPESDLPVELPPLDDFRPHRSDDPDAPPSPALSRAPREWQTVVRDGVRYRRERNTMPQWAGSCWYYLRYLDAGNGDRFVDPGAEAYWMAPGGVDLYVGGVEHAVLHLLYARFWHKVLYDLGHVSTVEPFRRLVNQGYILAYAYQDERGMYVPAEEVVEGPDGEFRHGGKPVTRISGKMGKSLKNSVTPDDLFEDVGCDTFRLYEMYMGPIEQSKVWNTKAIIGVHRFLQRVWRNLVDEESGALLVEESPADHDLARLLHRGIHEATADMEAMRFNTAIARLIELNNALVGRATVPREVAEALVLMLAPMAPHVAEELWQRLGHGESLAREPWPRARQEFLVSDEMEIVVQVKGRKRATVRLPAGADEETIAAAALADPGVQRHVEGKTIRKVIHVPGKLVNIVAS
jgi:leucyl-tRNA synthetase